ncbi:MAG: CoA ester lyase [Gammaproteobacteria bacterium]|nr:CoA ester lyase [Gammaproteobacteria bacterium]MCY4219654.1 CoA ester lyase [Gammaproteobacteria bacterium]MCY4275693.1 CoA ester lyase [Gammaproteobacteria bacterium]
MDKPESLTIPFRLQRSVLAVPGSNTAMIEKAAASAADCVLLDCEDSVTPDQKSRARRNIVSALNEIDWKKAGKTVSVRINGPESDQMQLDLSIIIEQAGTHINTIMIPKVSTPKDVHTVENLLLLGLQVSGLKHKIGLECLIETALGLVNVEAIAYLSCETNSSLEALHFGAADFSASCQSGIATFGQSNDLWYPSLQRLLVACRAYGLRAIDGPYGNFRDPQGYIDVAKGAAEMGFDGKWAIHPSQIKLANQVMSPTSTEIKQAQRILDALEQAQNSGQGAISLDGNMVDAASGKWAANIMNKTKLIANKLCV